ncbi:NUDIX hydrolase [Mycobacterium sp. 94-17]|uniref:NUDIX hydrolase n=1 Tax=Mycobacterium sp. 94-17 TaxID=2986147 RepID=UPI003B6344B6
MGQNRPAGRPNIRRINATPKPLPIAREFSAGGLVIRDITADRQSAVIIGRTDRRGRTRWSLPKGHIEIGERPEQTAVREVAEETGIRGDVLAPLGNIDYWFRAHAAIVHKTVHHYLLQFRECESAAVNDHEVTAVAWVPLEALSSRLAFADERRLAELAVQLTQTLRNHGPAALPAMPRIAPRRFPQRHSISVRAGNQPKPRRG